MSLPEWGTEEFFRHEAFLYRGLDEFVAGVVSFIREGVAAGEPVLVVVRAEKISALRAAFSNKDLAGVQFADMAEVGVNPARIIAAWQQFVREQAVPVRGIRGVGEPIDELRHARTLRECERHEAFLNVAFEGGPDFWLLCPYDVEALAPEVVEIAHRTHPIVGDGRTAWQNYSYCAVARAAPFSAPLPSPRVPTSDIAFGIDTLREVRQLIAEWANTAGLSPARARDIVLAVHELAMNSIEHGGGVGKLRLWIDDGYITCDVTDDGFLDDPLVGRKQPALDGNDGRGLWLVNQLCDLVEVSSTHAGATVRVHMTLDSVRG